MLSVLPEKTQVKEGEVCFIRLKYTDGNGAVKPLERGIINVAVSGGELLAIGNACPFNKLGYTGCETDTYYGEALAVVKANGENFSVTAGDGRYTGSAEITVKREING